MRAVFAAVCSAVLAHGGCSFSPGTLGVRPDASDEMSDGTVAPTCSDGAKNGDETDVDCGGSCSACAIGKSCIGSPDCAASICELEACRAPLSCAELHAQHLALGDGSYAIDPDGTASAAAVATFCDMTTDGGGWTLVGKVDGRFDMYGSWLISNVNVADLSTPTIATNSYACLDASELAVNQSTEVRLSNSARTRWVKWPLPAARAIGTFWRHSVGQTTIDADTEIGVAVTGWDGSSKTCYQNQYGIMNLASHGGAYPYTAYNTSGNTVGADLCMAVGTQTTATADGFSTNGNGFDAPLDEATWPNAAYNVAPHIAVWLR